MQLEVGMNYQVPEKGEQLPRMKNDTCCIINTNSNNKTGTHWTCLFKYKEKIYFMIVLHVIIECYHRIGIVKNG